MFTYHVVRNGYVPLLRWCITNGYIVTKEKEKGNTEDLHKIKHLNWETPWYAVATGEVSMLEYLKEHCGLVPTNYEEAKLILNGIVETISKLPLDKKLPLLAWLESNKCDLQLIENIVATFDQH
jgi:hypothetical protein